MTTVLSKSSPKMCKSGIFCLKFRHAFIKFCNYANSRVLTSNMTMFFSYSSHKIFKEDIFGLKFMDLNFYTKLCNKTISRKLIWNLTKLFFKFQPPRSKNQAFLVSNIKIFIIAPTFAEDKLEDKDFSYDNSIFKL